MEVLLLALFFISALIFFIAGKDDFGRTENKLTTKGKEEVKQENKQEVNEEVKQEIKQEIKQELNKEVKQEVNEEVEGKDSVEPTVGNNNN